jgi:hypothetical protein
MKKLLYSWITDGHRCNRVFIIGGYSDSLSHINKMIAEGKKDFPDISDDDISVSKIYYSDRYKYMSVISFSVPCSTHKDYFFCGDTIEFSW